LAVAVRLAEAVADLLIGDIDAPDAEENEFDTEAFTQSFSRVRTTLEELKERSPVGAYETSTGAARIQRAQSTVQGPS
jgi:hypothetical protein